MIDYYYPEGWKTSGDIRFDYGLIRLNTSPGEKTGYVGLKTVTSSEVGNIISITGYPGDLTENALTQQGESNKVAAQNDDLLSHQIDTNHGQSGALILNTSNQAIGVHRGYAGNNYNEGSAITPNVMNSIKSVMTGTMLTGCRENK